MELSRRIEAELSAAMERVDAGSGPPRLAAAMRHSVFPGGARVRPRLCLAVALACGDPHPRVTDAMAASIELMHCASLIHDDLPCFDDAETRRGRPSVHAQFGEPLAVLAGDALIVLAMEQLVLRAASVPHLVAPLALNLTRAVGMPEGITAGQGWESEPTPPLARYHEQKTGALFVAATMGGAISAGADPEPWAAVGGRLGQAYQVADDLMDAVGNHDACGKPHAQDVAHARPNAVGYLGVRGAVARLRGLVSEAVEAIPDCAGAGMLRELVKAQAMRLVPGPLATAAA
jgi:geranylgeranyl diphosphate synthase, type II